MTWCWATNSRSGDGSPMSRVPAAAGTAHHQELLRAVSDCYLAWGLVILGMVLLLNLIHPGCEGRSQRYTARGCAGGDGDPDSPLQAEHVMFSAVFAALAGSCFQYNSGSRPVPGSGVMESVRSSRSSRSGGMANCRRTVDDLVLNCPVAPRLFDLRRCRLRRHPHPDHAVRADGLLRAPFLSDLKRLVSRIRRRGGVVTCSRSGGSANDSAASRPSTTFLRCRRGIDQGADRAERRGEDDDLQPDLRIPSSRSRRDRFGGARSTACRPARSLPATWCRTFQRIRLFPKMTVLENIMVGRHIHSRAGFLAEMLNLPFTWGRSERIREKSFEIMELLGIVAMPERRRSASPTASSASSRSAGRSPASRSSSCSTNPRPG